MMHVFGNILVYIDILPFLYHCLVQKVVMTK